MELNAYILQYIECTEEGAVCSHVAAVEEDAV